MLPSILQPLFWDAVGNIRADLHKRYVVMARILQLGDELAMKWLEEGYSVDDLRNVVETSHNVSAQSRIYGE